jgi:phytoene dehydrogenase-like protein
VLTGKPVNRLVLEGKRCVGVGTEDGSEYGAREAVVSSIHVKHLIDMAPKEVWGVSFTYGVETWNPGVSLFASYYATSEPPLYPVEGGALAAVAAGIATSQERLFRLHPEFARGEVPLDDNQLLVLTPTVADPSRAPAGGHTLKLVAMHPYDCVDGPQRWDEIKDEVADSHLRLLRRYAPNLSEDKVLATEVRSPLDLERYNRHNWHGSCHGGDMGPAQSYHLRPAAGWASHRTPIEGLYQTGSTTHPGGSVTGAPGRNAAMVLLSDLGRDLAEVVSPEAAARAPKPTAATR